ncbi:acyltransferase-domain-containing protein [Radiomyces spectabilis]|uniref:acyltransferase-domain-containing protein n=1 Tax=Radiomyces spectabilis TaxID=64574 RepID=UPI00221F471D|nr:acyltransferase-domain-containing protein [Radiomyces spectabilis]KAI8384784.1 acyltransferase-domain-containing protein [Radiomyces spectabilis]
MRSFWRASRAVKLGTAATVMGGTCYYTFIYSRNTPQRPPPQTLEDSLVGQEAPSIFQWSSLPPFIERRYDPPYPENGPIWNAASTVVTGGVGLFAKFMLRYFQQTRVYNIDAFLKIVDEDNRDRALITVSNHESVWDDPFLWGVLPVRTLLDIHKMRWVLGAADICFTTIPKSLFFSLGQAIPTIRGCGIYQPAVNFAIHKANQNGWIHIFPEARVNQTASMIRFKWGVGRIIMEADRCPIVIPVWHNGTQLVYCLQKNAS